jgi:hypothetical protein
MVTEWPGPIMELEFQGSVPMDGECGSTAHKLKWTDGSDGTDWPLAPPDRHSRCPPTGSADLTCTSKYIRARTSADQLILRWAADAAGFLGSTHASGSSEPWSLGELTIFFGEHLTSID